MGRTWGWYQFTSILIYWKGMGKREARKVSLKSAKRKLVKSAKGILWEAQKVSCVKREKEASEKRERYLWKARKGSYSAHLCYLAGSDWVWGEAGVAWGLGQVNILLSNILLFLFFLFFLILFLFIAFPISLIERYFRQQNHHALICILTNLVEHPLDLIFIKLIIL